MLNLLSTWATFALSNEETGIYFNKAGRSSRTTPHISIDKDNNMQQETFKNLNHQRTGAIVSVIAAYKQGIAHLRNEWRVASASRKIQSDVGILRRLVDHGVQVTNGSRAMPKLVCLTMLSGGPRGARRIIGHS